MIFKNKAIKIISYILFAIILLAFLFFFLTYDFTPKKKYRRDNTNSSYSETFEEILVKEIEKSVSLNVMSIEFDSDTLNEIIFNSIDYNNEYIYETSKWALKGVTLRILKNYIVFNFHLSYKHLLNYSIKISAYFTIDVTDTEFILKLSRANIGSILIPSSFTKALIENDNEGSLRQIISQALETLKFGRVDASDVSVTIRKKDLFENIGDGIIGDILIGDYPKMRKAISSLLIILSNNNLLKVNIDRKIYFSLDYTKLLISSNTRNNYYIDEIIAKDINYKSIVNYLLKGENIPITSDLLNSVIYLDILGEINPNPASFNEITIESIYISKNNDTYLMNIIYHIFTKYISLDLEFKEDNNILTLNTLYIGVDPTESPYDYLSIRDKEMFKYIKDILSEYGINLSSDYNIGLEKLLKDLSIEYNSLEDDTLMVKENEYLDIITENVMSNVFISEIEEALPNEIDFTVINTICDSFNELKYTNKTLFLTKLKEYFKEIDLDVYNYISGLLKEEA